MGNAATIRSHVWFYDLFGFSEKGYADTKAAFKVDVPVLRCLESKRSFLCGRFAREQLGMQRARVLANKKLQATLGRKRGLTLKVVTGDVSKLHATKANKHATFQVMCVWVNMHLATVVFTVGGGGS